MSTDGDYIFAYEALPYLEPTPSQKDIEYLKEKYGGEFQRFGCGNVFWEKPKYTLLNSDIENLNADQIFERKTCEMWEKIK